MLETSFCFRDHRVGFPICSSTSIVHIDAEDCTRLSIMLARNHFLGNKSPWFAIVLLAYQLVVVKQKHCLSIVLSPINHRFPPQKTTHGSPRFQLFSVTTLVASLLESIREQFVEKFGSIIEVAKMPADGAEQIQLGENVDENSCCFCL